MEKLSFAHIAWDTWKASRNGMEGIRSRQLRRLNELVGYVRATSPYFANRYKGLPGTIKNIRELPPVMKPDLVKYFDDWVTDRQVTKTGIEAFIADKSLIGHHYLDRYFVCTTSGTTGVPTLLVHDAGMLALSSAVELARGVPNWGLKLSDWLRFVQMGGRVAAVFVTGGHFQAVASMERRYLDNPRRKKTARMFSALAPLPEIVNGLNEYQPAMLAAYPSSLALLAEEQQAGRLQIHPLLVLPTGETLAPALREQIRSAFGAQVRQNYGSSEMPVIAYDCGRGGLHINVDWVILEPVDADYQPTKPGQASHKVLVTNLANRVQPFIRYEMGDSITVDPEPCPCGSILPSITVEGRNDDILRFMGPEGNTVPIMPMALWSVIKDTPGVYRFQAIQTADSQLSMRLEIKAGVDQDRVWNSLRERVQNYLCEHNLSNVEIVLSNEAPAPNPLSGKFRHVWKQIHTRETQEGQAIEATSV